MSYKSGYIESSNGPCRENSRSRVEDSRHVYCPIESVPYGSLSLHSPPSTRHTMSHHDHGDREYSEAHFPVMPARSLRKCQVAAHPPSVPSFVSHQDSPPTVHSLWERQVTEGPISQSSLHAYDINLLPLRPRTWYTPLRSAKYLWLTHLSWHLRLPTINPLIAHYITNCDRWEFDRPLPGKTGITHRVISIPGHRLPVSPIPPF
ncbi:uncharacterized protein EI90DRAFT_3128445 [Cantharellus anzutake]|uniref:uncharacterized protein n=1 Tax=Cantharellus anzutake TaxID=1750568 RepID=UPI0019081A4F|nr:uncharacterized protein EI90DRAFT_3128445 [Cantharellus anzutake]KAF8325608.1 hypothetical protein EI90DRAFT_3128445 [Cantharellus anzutake]